VDEKKLFVDGIMRVSQHDASEMKNMEEKMEALVFLSLPGAVVIAIVVLFLFSSFRSTLWTEKDVCSQLMNGRLQVDTR